MLKVSPQLRSTKSEANDKPVLNYITNHSIFSTIAKKRFTGSRQFKILSVFQEEQLKSPQRETKTTKRYEVNK